MTSRNRIYLDNAATSWPKPPRVCQAVYEYLSECGAAAGRSVYREATDVERIVTNCRAKLARLVGIDELRRVIFTANGTDSLNLALHGLLRAGDHVVTTVTEHNSVLRPLSFLAARHGVDVSRVPCDAAGRVSPSDIRLALRPKTRLVIINHASNVTGTLQPIEEIGKIARSAGAFFAVDMAQSLGHVPINMQTLNIDLLAAPAHKGLLGPLGLGVLVVGPGVEPHLEPIRQGGTGTKSDDIVQPDLLPEKYESGNLNVPAIVGLEVAVDFLIEQGLERIRAHEQALTQSMLEGIRDIAGVKLYGPPDAGSRVGVVSIQLQAFDPQEAAALLDSAYSIQVRSGLHCAPLIHESLGTLRSGGTIRLSIGPFNSEADVQSTIKAIGELIAG